MNADIFGANNFNALPHFAALAAAYLLAIPIGCNSPEAMARILEGLITGMGFIGGGAILRQSESVKGTATAASLWVTGAIGASVGLGSYDVAVMLAVVTVTTLWVMEPLKRLGHMTPKDKKAAKAPRRQSD
jgi:putative Mg2+ transporter-C (MgtC) family protein